MTISVNYKERKLQMNKYYDIDLIYPKSILKIKLSPRHNGIKQELKRRKERKIKND